MLFKRKKLKLDPEKIVAKAKAAHEKSGQIIHKVTSPILKGYLKEGHIRVRTLILNEEKEVLLVRSWYGNQKWSLPGGGIQRVEKPVEAAIRETFEETGIRVAVDDMQELGSFTNPDPKKPFTIACFKVTIPKREPHLAKHRRVEMLDASWFPISNLPKDHDAEVSIAVSLLR